MNRLAAENVKAFDAFMDKEQGVSMDITGLLTRLIYSEDRNELVRTMNRLTGSFPFECEAVYIENGSAFEVTLPHLVFDDKPLGF